MTKEAAIQVLRDCRVRIDELDLRLLELLNQRTQIVEQIGQAKRWLDMPIYEPKREDQVIANITGANRGPLSAEAVRRVFERIIDEMRTIQRERMESGAGTQVRANESEK